jgi:hypothetical protein
MLQVAPLAVGRKISIRSLQSDCRRGLLDTGRVATIETISPDQISLRLLRPGPRLPLREGERVRIKSSTDKALYFWEAKILKVPDTAKQQLTISILGAGVTLQRRDHSFRPLSEAGSCLAHLSPRRVRAKVENPFVLMKRSIRCGKSLISGKGHLPPDIV